MTCRVGAVRSKFELSRNLHAFLPEKSASANLLMCNPGNDISCLLSPGSPRALTDKYDIANNYIDDWYFDFIGNTDRIMAFSGKSLLM